jgi:hypothetical protein
MRLGPYATSGTYTSRVIDAGATADWTTLTSVVATPAGTALQIQTRSGDTATPGTGWSPWQPLGAGGIVANPSGRYLQYQAGLSTTTATVSPSLERVSITYAVP